MKRSALCFLVPPYAVCRYGCAGCCAAPIGVFWIAGITGLVYGLFYGGPLNLSGISWNTVGLGAILWAIAVVWALITVRTADEDRCARRSAPLCNKIVPRTDEQDPFEEVRKAR